MNAVDRQADGTMPFLEHLEELRWTIIKCAVAVIVTSCGVYVFWKPLFEYVFSRPLSGINPRPQLIFTTPSEAFMVSLKVAFFGGIFISAPFLLYQMWKFIAPGLFQNEKKYTLLVLFSSGLCFAGGVAFSFFAVPQAIRFLTTFSPPSLVPYFTVNSYMSFVLKFTLAFGAVFQMPPAALILTKAGLVNYRTLLGHWRLATIIIFIIAAILTPPDLVSQLIMAVPLFVLFFISIGISWLVGGKKETAGPIRKD